MATITSLTALPDGSGVFTTANHDQINTNVTSQNTNNTNLNAAIASIVAGGFTATDAITALAGGAKPGTLLTSVVNRVSTVATAADSVSLPASSAGLICVVVNDAAKSLQMFGLGTDTINDVATATGVPLAGTSMAVMFCPMAGKWYSLGQWVIQATSLFASSSIASAAAVNYQGTEGGANNAITCNLTDPSGNALTLAAGLSISLKLAHSLQAGANTLAINGGATKSIKKSTNPANDIGTAYVSGSIVNMIYDGTVWQVLGQ